VRYLSLKNGNADAFTGLEAAIVLIAFVVVAAVFSYVVLGAGFYTTQKSQQVVHAGVTEAASNIIDKGGVYLFYPDGVSQCIRFDIALASGGIPVDIDKLEMTMSTPNMTPEKILPNHIPGDLYPAPGYWSVYQQSPNPQTDNLLRDGELFTIHLTPPSDMPLTSRSKFTLELNPENGASLSIERNIPAGLKNQTTLLY